MKDRSKRLVTGLTLVSLIALSAYSFVPLASAHEANSGRDGRQDDRHDLNEVRDVRDIRRVDRRVDRRGDRRDNRRDDRRQNDKDKVNVVLRARLSGAAQVPSVATTTASGEGVFVINTKNNTVKFNIKIRNLSSSEAGAHIHGPAGVGANAGILFTLPAGNHKVGTWTYDESLEATILGGMTYVNVHTVNFPAGEIRGQIVK